MPPPKERALGSDPGMWVFESPRGHAYFTETAILTVTMKIRIE
jgi:hypothetical protein